MSSHEYFRELCALAAIGQLSAEEDEQLSRHLLGCSECREANAEYAHVVQHQLPQADSIRWRLKQSVPKGDADIDVRDRFLARARAEGLVFTQEIELNSHSRQQISFWGAWGWRLAWVSSLVLLIGMAGVTYYRANARKGTVSVESVAEARLRQENASLRDELGKAQREIERNSVQLAAAVKDGTVSAETLKQLQRQLEESRRQSESLGEQLELAEAKKTELLNEVSTKDAMMADLNAKNAEVRRENVDNLSARVVLQARVNELNRSLEQQSATFEQERELTVASKDVRQLMGARNLHIMDVHDTDGEGKAARSFGRVFYAEGQSLVFYAFDLPSGKLTPAKYTFQAWGEREAVSHSVRKLGTFVIDDHEQRRWVLKVNDAKLLKGIDSVFVTAEVLGDAGSPHGKKLLYAYIVGEANHP